MKTKNIIVIGLSVFAVITINGCVVKNAKAKVHHISNKNGYTNNSNPFKKLKFQRVTYGKASFYAKKFNGRKTASGEIYNMYAKTAAHRTLPFNTMVKVTDMITKRSDIVRINDRGPHSSSRIIDLSYASAKKLGLISRGVSDVKIEIVGSDGKVQPNLSFLRNKASSIQACVGDNCKAKIGKSGNSSTKIKPFTLLADANMQELSNRGDIDADPYSSRNFNRNSFPKIDTFAQKTSIQVGAFRRYEGAKIYAKRYSLLSRQYKTIIKNEFKESKPIYRVRIEGFATEDDARNFMSRYSLNSAFLVSR